MFGMREEEEGTVKPVSKEKKFQWPTRKADGS
jgi:hypothetical protein